MEFRCERDKSSRSSLLAKRLQTGQEVSTGPGQSLKQGDLRQRGSLVIHMPREKTGPGPTFECLGKPRAHDNECRLFIGWWGSQVLNLQPAQEDRQDGSWGGKLSDN